MNDKNNNEIEFSENKDGKKITYKVEKKEEEQVATANDGKTKKTFKNVSGNNWFYANAKWKGPEDKEFRNKFQPKLGLWGLLAVLILLIGVGIAIFIRNRNKKKSLDEEKFL